jgi:preprotein translocase subunit SecA
MIQRTLTKLFGSKHDRDVKRLQPQVAAINALEPALRALSDEQLRTRTVELREQLAAGSPLDALLVPAFATVREAARRTLGMRHYDVQLVGGMVLHQGKIAEMKTGEGKTLVATLPVYLNALPGQGVHVVTVNDYLARRDAEWMGQVYRFLGLTVGVIAHGISDEERRAAYAADVTYAQNNELGFDYLRDNMKFDLSAMVQRGAQLRDRRRGRLDPDRRGTHAADHLRSRRRRSVDKYYVVDRIVPKLEARHEEIEEKDGASTRRATSLSTRRRTSVALTDDGVAKVEKLLGLTNLYDLENARSHSRRPSGAARPPPLRARRRVPGEGRPGGDRRRVHRAHDARAALVGRLHQAVEAKEGVKIERENQTLATVTFQNFFRMYAKLAGMTGTAATEAGEFEHIYKLDVVVVPTNQPMIREDRPDLVFRTAREKWDAVVEEIEDCHQRGQPALVGTLSIEKSEMLSGLLKRKGIPHVVLNAKYHEREAAIVAQAGRKGAVTIATNMAGRGTDILLGGNPEGLARAEADPAADPEGYREAFARYTAICEREREEVLAAGGLHIIGTERHESRRIDNQLRGRAGRQGDPGSSRFFLSLEDDLMRIFGSDRIQGLLGKLGMQEGEAIEHGMVTRSIERAQRQVEGRNFEVRKHLLQYDDVMNKQREAIYTLRRDIFEGREGKDYVLRVAHDIVENLVATHCPERIDPSEWTVADLASDVLAYFDIDVRREGLDLAAMGDQEIQEELWSRVASKYEEKEARVGSELMRLLERDVMLRFVDSAWKDHLFALDHLKEGIGLRGYGQRDPLQEYKRESFQLFGALKDGVEDSVVKTLFRLEAVSEEQLERERSRRAHAAGPSRMVFSAPDLSASGMPPAAPGGSAPDSPFGAAAQPPVARQPVRVEKTPGRNDPCWCGSGKKYKKCHGAAAGVGA